MLIKELEKSMKSMPINGFKFKKEIMAFSWTRELSDRQESIIISYRTFHPNMYRLNIPRPHISYNLIESIIDECVMKLNVQKTWGDTSTIDGSLYNITGIDFNVFETRIDNDIDFQLVSKEIIKLVENGAFPFFEKYDTLEKLADLLANLTPQEVVPYISGAILFPKTILILKLAKHANFKDKLIEFRNILNSYTSKKEIYKQTLMIYDELFREDLES